ncbi:MAG: RluA family pseudouridine synthase [Holosporaceae bacterium]|jgi:23S rRNA pseudouridine955/2504/2580 synthase|nr:RluA family pseudouridine synthase [Holosporaceae bacterium]
MKHVVTVDEDNCRADKIVKNLCRNISYACVQKLFRQKKVKRNRGKIFAADRLQAGDILEVFADLTEEKKPDPMRDEKLFQQLQRMVIFENEDFFALNKPAGLAVQSGVKISMCVDILIKSHPGSECRLVHRLDRDTSGVLLVAKNQKSAQKLTKLFREGKIQKTYLAIVDGRVNGSGVIENFLAKSFRDNKEKMQISDAGQRAVTKYNQLESVGCYTLLELNPLTGRKHQLRVHCADVLKTPIVGDKKYNPYPVCRELFLHANKLRIQELGVEITAEIPVYFRKFLADVHRAISQT